MDTSIVIAIIVVVLVVVAVAAAVGSRRKRTAHLKDQFGPEYEHTVRETEDQRAAERDLRSREKRRSQFEVTPLTGDAAARYREEWAVVQQGFVDQPAGSVQAADRLVVRMMRDSGYPVDDFDHRVDDISVDHPEVAQHYRAAHEIALAQQAGTADTEQLRLAVTSYRELVDALLGDGEPHVGTHRGTTTTGEQS